MKGFGGSKVWDVELLRSRESILNFGGSRFGM